MSKAAGGRGSWALGSPGPSLCQVALSSVCLRLRGCRWSFASSVTEHLGAFLVSSLKVRLDALGRVEGPDSGAGWCQLVGGRWPEVFVPCTLDYSHAALTVYICFTVHRFVNIIA